MCSRDIPFLKSCFIFPSFSLEVRFQLTENDYRSNEAEAVVPAVVNKNMRLANPVTFLLTPYNVSHTEDTGQPLPHNIPADDNPSSPNRAKCKAVKLVPCSLDPSFRFSF